MMPVGKNNKKNNKKTEKPSTTKEKEIKMKEISLVTIIEKTDEYITFIDELRTWYKKKERKKEDEFRLFYNCNKHKNIAINISADNFTTFLYETAKENDLKVLKSKQIPNEKNYNHTYANPKSDLLYIQLIEEIKYINLNNLINKDQKEKIKFSRLVFLTAEAARSDLVKNIILRVLSNENNEKISENSLEFLFSNYSKVQSHKYESTHRKKPTNGEHLECGDDKWKPLQLLDYQNYIESVEKDKDKTMEYEKGKKMLNELSDKLGIE